MTPLSPNTNLAAASQPVSPARLRAGAAAGHSEPTRPESTRPRLMTEPEVLSALRGEIEQTSLATVAKHYSIKPQQISDVLYGRANLSQRMIERLRLRMHKFFERVPAAPQAAIRQAASDALPAADPDSSKE